MPKMTPEKMGYLYRAGEKMFGSENPSHVSMKAYTLFADQWGHDDRIVKALSIFARWCTNGPPSGEDVMYAKFQIVRDINQPPPIALAYSMWLRNSRIKR